MIIAIYKQRHDGDFDFVAAFETEQLPSEPSNWPQEIRDWLEAEGETVRVIENIPLNQLPHVLIL